MQQQPSACMQSLSVTFENAPNLFTSKSCEFGMIFLDTVSFHLRGIASKIRGKASLSGFTEVFLMFWL
jgi:hypothetical protein